MGERRIQRELFQTGGDLAEIIEEDGPSSVKVNFRDDSLDSLVVDGRVSKSTPERKSLIVRTTSPTEEQMDVPRKSMFQILRSDHLVMVLIIIII